jgi:hypothetical protein
MARVSDLIFGLLSEKEDHTSKEIQGKESPEARAQNTQLAEARHGREVK